MNATCKDFKTITSKITIKNGGKIVSELTFDVPLDIVTVSYERPQVEADYRIAFTYGYGVWRVTKQIYDAYTEAAISLRREGYEVYLTPETKNSKGVNKDLKKEHRVTAINGDFIVPEIEDAVRFDFITYPQANFNF